MKKVVTKKLETCIKVKLSSLSLIGRNSKINKLCRVYRYKFEKLFTVYKSVKQSFMKK